MAWFAAHAIMYFEILDGSQENFQVYENVILIHAETVDEAFAKASEYGRRDEGDDSASLRVGNKRARRVFGGIRKLMSVSHGDPDGQLRDGDEVTYSEIVVDDRPALDQLIGDQDVELLYVGQRPRGGSVE